MLDFSSARGEASVKEEYTRGLVAAVVRSNFYARYVMFRPSVSGNFADESVNEYVQRSTSETFSSSDILAAAAAVGDIATVQRYISEGVSVLSYDEHGLCNPIIAAASVGKVDTLKILLAQVTKEIDNPSSHLTLWKQRTLRRYSSRPTYESFARHPFEAAVKAAIRAEEVESAIMLIEFATACSLTLLSPVR
jgi:hypothetical protein